MPVLSFVLSSTQQRQESFRIEKTANTVVPSIAPSEAYHSGCLHRESESFALRSPLAKKFRVNRAKNAKNWSSKIPLIFGIQRMWT